MASLKNIEKLIQFLESYGNETTPEWIKGIEAPPVHYNNNDLNLLNDGVHISGQLREMSDLLWETKALEGLAILLGEAAEKLDDAHEEWLEDRAADLQAHLDCFL